MFLLDVGTAYAQWGYIEPLVWSSVGKVFSGCGSALVGSGEQVQQKLHDYMNIGFRAFIHSGFPLIEESNYFGQLVLPYMPVVSLGDVYNTPLWHKKPG